MKDATPNPQVNPPEPLASQPQAMTKNPSLQSPSDVQPESKRLDAPNAADAPPAAKTVAVLVCHGMGQQVPFQTLSETVDAFCDYAAEAGATGVKTAVGFEADSSAHASPNTSSQTGGQDKIPYAEASFTDKGKAYRVSFYEVYWAPCTEGNVGIVDVIFFLFSAGWSGIEYSLRGFERWMFGGYQNFGRQWLALFALCFTLIAVVSVLVIYGVFVLVLAADLSKGIGVRWLDTPLIGRLHRELVSSPMVWVGIVAALLFAWRCISVMIYIASGVPSPKKKPSPPSPVTSSLLRVCGYALTLFIFAALIACAFSAGGMLYALITGWNAAPETPPDFYDALARTLTLGGWFFLPDTWLQVLYPLLMLSIAGVFYNAWWFLIQYFGDVAAYISAHTVSRFYTLRQAIQQRAERTAEHLYSLSTDDGNPKYDAVMIAGHSLGSVVGYDALNALIIRDQMQRHKRGVLKRTTHLITFGSPLDKTAFIFRSQVESGLIRESLAAAVQPLIQTNETRQNLRWINIWSPFDWISSTLDFYDHAQCPREKHYPVDNRVDSEAWFPLKAHTEYWEHTAFRKALYEAATQEL